MHPFGGTPICPRCSKAVYAAEQIMGPGRKLYHKPCLTCTSCGKRLDSYNLVEHDQEPYCKNCHIKLFGTRDLRLANLPNRDEVFLSPTSPPASPTRANAFSPRRAASPPARTNSNNAPALPIRRHVTGGGATDKAAFSTSSPAPPMLKPTRTLSPVRGSSANYVRGVEDTFAEYEERDTIEEEPIFQSMSGVSAATHTGRGVGGLPRTVPLSPTRSRANGAPSSPIKSSFPEALSSDIRGKVASPIPPTSTGTRYGVALTGGGGASPMSPMMTGRQWGVGTPTCPRCGKTVYFAEQAKAIGKTYHKGCLRCTECSTLLDSTRLTERDGNPFCNRCYGKLYGPQGSGYALLGKAGG
ncbi:hypothetical protein AcV5_010140 [Taiwanofungus camphoratus]|nr:hypothetical protein AcV5_010140 [Antrodia cinnamomea]KAI0946094.1 hypothetical protein AcV7_010160 [Antrodia cinnamomea]